MFPLNTKLPIIFVILAITRGQGRLRLLGLLVLLVDLLERQCCKVAK